MLGKFYMVLDLVYVFNTCFAIQSYTQELSFNLPVFIATYKDNECYLCWYFCILSETFGTMIHLMSLKTRVEIKRI